MLNVIPGTWLDAENPGADVPLFSDLDGAILATFLAENGCSVKTHYDTGRNGIVLLENGLKISTNGWVSEQKKAPATAATVSKAQ